MSQKYFLHPGNWGTQCPLVVHLADQNLVDRIPAGRMLLGRTLAQNYLGQIPGRSFAVQPGSHHWQRRCSGDRWSHKAAQWIRTGFWNRNVISYNDKKSSFYENFNYNFLIYSKFMYKIAYY